MNCVDCGKTIPPGTNHIAKPPAHIACAYEAGRLAAGAPNSTTEDERRIRNWVSALPIGAVSGAQFEVSARAAEEPDVAVWDRQLPGGLHMPWVAVHETPCPGEPWSAVPDRWNGSMTCKHKHFHPRKTPVVFGARTADLSRPSDTAGSAS